MWNSLKSKEIKIVHTVKREKNIEKKSTKKWNKKMENYIVGICKITNVDCFKWNTE